VKRWLWLSGFVAAALLLVTALGPRTASARTRDLVVGCNPETMTYADGTAITEVASSVAPAGSLKTIWQFVPAEGRWLGYMAGAPAEVSDLQTAERLGVLFICVSQVATITMPDIGGGG